MGYLYLFIVISLSLYLLYKYHKLNIWTGLIITILLITLLIVYLIDNNSIKYVYSTLMLIFLFLIFIVDLKEYWIPDLSIIGILLLNVTYYIIMNTFYNYEFSYGGMIINGILSLVFIILSIVKKEELMGFGDIKLLFVISIGLPTLSYLLLLMISSIIGLIIVLITKKKKIPFGPAIIIAYIIIIHLKK